MGRLPVCLSLLILAYPCCQPAYYLAEHKHHDRQHDQNKIRKFCIKRRKAREERGRGRKEKERKGWKGVRSQIVPDLLEKKIGKIEWGEHYSTPRLKCYWCKQCFDGLKMSSIPFFTLVGCCAWRRGEERRGKKRGKETMDEACLCLFGTDDWEIWWIHGEIWSNSTPDAHLSLSRALSFFNSSFFCLSNLTLSSLCIVLSLPLVSLCFSCAFDLRHALSFFVTKEKQVW